MSAAWLPLGRACHIHHGLMALDLPCPNCGTQMYPEQAHNRCPSCLYYEPCCDGAPQQCPRPATADPARHATATN